MAVSRFAYVKSYELPDPLLPNTYLVLRLDGHNFHRFSDVHSFQKPNDERALNLMDRAARQLMEEYPDIVLGFGESDEFSFLLRKSCSLYNRRHSKILSTLTSFFTSAYVYYWRDHFGDLPLSYPPSFDARLVVYPSMKEVRDYFAWRQADTHINNLYNTAFWALVSQSGKTTTEAHQTLRNTVSSTKHEMLHTQFNINYNTLPEQFRKGSVVVKEEVPRDLEEIDSGLHDTSPALAPVELAEEIVERKKISKKGRKVIQVRILHCDIISDQFWKNRPEISDR